MKGKRHAFPGQCAEAGDLGRPFVPDALSPVCFTEFVHVMGVDRNLCAEFRKLPALLGGGKAKMFDGEVMVESGPVLLKALKDVEHQLDAEISGRVDLDLQAPGPCRTAHCFKLLRRGHPFALMPVDEAGIHYLHQFGKDAAIGKRLDVVGKGQPTTIEVPEGLDTVQFGLRVLRPAGTADQGHAKWSGGSFSHVADRFPLGFLVKNVESLKYHVSESRVSSEPHPLTQPFEPQLEPFGLDQVGRDPLDRVDLARLERVSACCVDLAATVRFIRRL